MIPFHMRSMDTQRFYLLKKRPRSTPSLRRAADSSSPKPSSYNPSPTTSRSRFSLPLIFDNRQIIPPKSKRLSFDTQSDSDSTGSPSFGDSESTAFIRTPTSSSSGSGSDASATLENDYPLLEKALIDVYDNGEFITTRTIIPRSSRRRCFSRPRTPSSVTRPSSLMNFSTLNCFTGTDAFEQDVDFIRAQRENLLETPESPIKVMVIREESRRYEESWRESIQTVLYGRRPSDNVESAIQCG